ncbi:MULTISPECIES: DUF6452 family protein [Chryseobacterium]|uniref:Lipoprotein n=1 Tax=Chryseobacterium taihuense TaxID=1141221 RepID=A0A1G9P4Q8_9FLAO|nr:MULTISPECIES: DUF6452 family protein [Chryseobacterium]QQV01964.1 hypothetical protein I6I61_12885 [Chryseobacterium sp. FDAARGOS 1104]SDL93207.1 hypothetical protein SAMN05216273_1095 [Chryseobacterium taihuense]VFB04811.1 Uncharacterised protein [Chryseobacterium taihuense]
MKYFKFIILFFIFSSVTSCGGDDDICESGEGTPRMKIMFKTGGKITVLDSIKIFADLGTSVVDFGWNRNVDSVFVPLRVDDSPFTDIYIKTSAKEDSSKVRINYTTKSIYVSPGCGVKRNYENLNSVLLLPNSVKSVEQGQNFIQDEEKTNLYLNF